MIYDKGLLQELDMLRVDMKKHKQDLLIAIYGAEGSGKSTFAGNLAVYLDPTLTPLNLNVRVAQTIEDYARITPDIKPYQVGWWDEAHRFSKRGQNDNLANRFILEYLQDIRGALKIQIWCFPELQEIDRKVIQRARLFFETIKKGEQFFVRGWTKKQIKIMVESLKLSNRKSQMEKWIGTPRDPKRVFSCDYKNFSNPNLASLVDIMKEYDKMKEGSIRRSEERLRSHGFYDPLDVAKEIVRRTTMSWSWAEKQAYEIMKFALQDGWGGEDELVKEAGRYKIKSKTLFDNMVGLALQNTPSKTDVLIPMEVAQPSTTETNISDHYNVNNTISQSISNTNMEHTSDIIVNVKEKHISDVLITA